MCLHSFSKALDELITQAYVQVRRGVGFVMLRPSISEVMEQVDPLVGSIDSPEYMLLRKFDLLYRELCNRSPSPWNDPGKVSGEITSAK